MTTTVYQKFISEYAETFTLIEMAEGIDYTMTEVVPAAKVAKMDEDELYALIEEICDSRNEKASWSDEEDARAAHHQKWDEINSFFDKKGM